MHVDSRHLFARQCIDVVWRSYLLITPLSERVRREGGVMSNCCKCNLPEISRLLSHAHLHTFQNISSYLLRNITKIVLV